MKHTAFFGDGEKTFALTTPMIHELERKTGHGIGAIFKRVSAMTFGIADIVETIRLGLIGGGTAPFVADALVKTYVDDRPLAETFPVALGILEVAWFGSTITDAQDETGQPDPTDPADNAARPRADIAEAFASDVQEAAASGDLAAAVREADHE